MNRPVFANSDTTFRENKFQKSAKRGIRSMSRHPRSAGEATKQISLRRCERKFAFQEIACRFQTVSFYKFFSFGSFHDIYFSFKGLFCWVWNHLVELPRSVREKQRLTIIRACVRRVMLVFLVGISAKLPFPASRKLRGKKAEMERRRNRSLCHQNSEYEKECFCLDARNFFSVKFCCILYYGN